MAASQVELIVNQIRLLSPDELAQLLKKVVELLEQKQSGLSPTKPDNSRYSFIGIGHSGQKDLSSRAEEILEQEADRREGWSLK
jgi:hypothetical protein